MRVAIGLAAVVAVAALAVVGGAAASRTDASSPCGELPAQLRSMCGGPGVTCTAHQDKHTRWEVAFATEPTMAKATGAAKLAIQRGFGWMPIEKDTVCSNGSGVYELAHARFHTRAAAVKLLQQAKAAGFTFARTEES